MNRRERNQRGLMAPQPAAQIAALDFIHAREAFDRAMTLAHSSNIDEADAAAEEASRLAERLIEVPAKTPAQIAEKVRAYMWRSVLSVDVARVEARYRIADSDSDHAKSLLAIYLDLTRLSEAHT